MAGHPVIGCYGVARVGGAFIKGAFTGCALLIAPSTPAYAPASWLGVSGGRRIATHPPWAAPDRDPSTPGGPGP